MNPDCIHLFTLSQDYDGLCRAIKHGVSTNAVWTGEWSTSEAGQTLDCPKGWTPLHCAVYVGNKDIVNKLLEHGADVNGGDCDGNSPLHRAMERQDPEAMEVLLRNKAEVDTPNIEGLAPLDDAVKQGLQYLANAQLSLTDHVDLINDGKRTPFTRCMEMLLDAGAKVLHGSSDPLNAFPDGDDAKTPHILQALESLNYEAFALLAKHKTHTMKITRKLLNESKKFILSSFDDGPSLATDIALESMSMEDAIRLALCRNYGAIARRERAGVGEEVPDEVVDLDEQLEMDRLVVGFLAWSSIERCAEKYKMLVE